MSADEQPESNEPATAPSERPGAMLKTAREAAKLSEEDVARELRMTVSKVRALEADDYDRLHSDTFIRGYLRTYAKLLGQDPHTVLDAYKQARREAGLGDEPEESPIQINVPPPTRSLWKFGLWIVVLLVGIWALSVWFLGNHREPAVRDKLPEDDIPAETQTSELQSPKAETDAFEPDPSSLAPSQPASAPETSLENASGNIEPSEEQSEDREQPDVEPVASSEGDVVSPQALTLASEEPTPAADETLDALRLSFSEECWVEVTDSRGDVLETDLLQPGQTLNLNGEAPFTVKLGNAAAVTIELNGEPFDFELPTDGRYRVVTVN